MKFLKMSKEVNRELSNLIHSRESELVNKELV